MHSIKTFWSPELKKERALRKEESAKYSLINDQLKLLSTENQVRLFDFIKLLFTYHYFLTPPPFYIFSETLLLLLSLKNFLLPIFNR